MLQILTVEELNNLCKNTMIEHLGIEFTELTNGHVVATMPIDHRTIQPMQRLHGGAIMPLAESVVIDESPLNELIGLSLVFTSCENGLATKPCDPEVGRE